MPNFFGGKAIPDKLKKELDARLDANSLNQWFATKTVWVHMMSMCDVCDSSVLKLSGFANAAYEDKTDFGGLRPNPVITSIKVSAQGNYGTTRKATVTLLAFTEDQLNKISDCYLISNMSVRIEFGWSISAAGDLAPAPVATARTATDAAAICDINTQRNTYPMYDGLQGIVGKWGITYNKDGQYWEVSIDLIAASTPVLGQPVHDASATCICTEKQEDPTSGKEEDVEVEKSAYQSFLEELIQRAAEGGDVAEYVEEELGLKKGGCQTQINSPARKPNGESFGMFDSLSTFLSTAGSYVGLTTPDTEEAYITLEAFFAALQKYSLAASADNEKESIYCKFDLKTFSKGVRKGIYLMSTDPHICLFPGGDRDGDGAYGELKDRDLLNSCIIQGGTNLAAILVNVIYLNKTLKDAGKGVKLQDYISSVLTGINQASANLWELTVIDSAQCGDKNTVPTLTLIDTTQQETLPEYVFKLKGLKIGSGDFKIPALVRDINLSLKLSSAMQSQALYASTRNQVREDVCADNQFKGEQSGYTNLAAPKPADKPVSIKCGDKCKPPDSGSSTSEQVSKSFLQLRAEITQAHKDDLYTKLVKYYGEADTSGSSGPERCAKMIVPFELGITLDGIGGFQFGQQINCDIIPKKQQDRYTYTITEVAHDISYGDWTTTIKSVARYK